MSDEAIMRRLTSEARGGFRKVAEFNAPIVSMLAHGESIYVATSNGVYRKSAEDVFGPVKSGEYDAND